MKWVILAVLIFAQQPSKPPESQGTTKDEGSQVSKQADAGDTNKQPTMATLPPSVSNQHPPSEVQSSGARASDETFTGLLVIVGFLQFFALIGQVVIYCRQAKLMEHQTREATRQRVWMGRQWRAMQGQLGQMKAEISIENTTLRLQYRPRVIVREIMALEFNLKLGEPMECEFKFTIVNAGATAAHITGGQLQMRACIEHIMQKYDCTEGDRWPVANFTLQPGQSMTYQEVLSTGAANNIEWANFHAGIEMTNPPRSVLLVGTIEYTDELNIPRRTGIRRRYSPKTKTFYPLSDSEGEYAD